MSAHSPFGPSSAHRWKPCPGSVILCAGFPNTSSDAAIEGSAAHCVAKHLLTGEEVSLGLPVEPGVIYNPTRDRLHIDGGLDYHGSVVVTAEMIAFCWDYVDYCRALPAEQALVETRVDYSEFVPMGFGTSDFIAISGDTIDVVDLKYGTGKRVYAAGNPQGLLYALGSYIAIGKPPQVKKARVHIHQPRLDHIDVAEFSIEEVIEYGHKAGASARAALAALEDHFLDITPLLNPGEEQCFWCAAKATCPARAGMALRTAMVEFSTVSDVLDELVLEPTIPVREPKLLTPTDLSLLLPAVKHLKKWCNDVEAAAMRVFLDTKGAGMPGAKLVNGRGSNEWRDAELATNTLVLEYGLDEDAVMPRSLVSPAQAKKLVGGKAFKSLESLVEKRPGKATLVPASDPRPAIDVMAGAEFSVETQTEEGENV